MSRIGVFRHEIQTLHNCVPTVLSGHMRSLYLIILNLNITHHINEIFILTYYTRISIVYSWAVETRERTHSKVDLRKRLRC